MQIEPSGLTELSKWISEFRKISVAKTCESSYQRSGTCREINCGGGREICKGAPLSLWLSTDLHTHRVKFCKGQGPGKNHWKLVASETKSP